jgi:hypothetical protein
MLLLYIIVLIITTTIAIIITCISFSQSSPQPRILLHNC